MSRARMKAIVRQFTENGMKLLLEDPRNVRDLLATQGLDVFDLIDFDRAKLVRTTYVQRDFRHLEADVVLRAPLRKPGKRGSARQITIYILIEHQSEPDAMMVFRVLEYVVQIYKAQTRAWRQKHDSFAGLRLNPVLPIVFYTGTRRWDSLGQVIDLVEMGEKFRPMIPGLAPLFLNLSALPAVRLETAGFFGWVLRLVQQRRARPAEFQDLLGKVVGHLEAMSPEERFRWLELLSYIQALVYHERDWGERSVLQEEIESSVETDEHRKEVYAMGQSYAEYLTKRGMKKGELGALRRSLLNLLTKRFGELPPKTVSVIEAEKNIEQLDDWLERLLTAGKLNDVGIG